MRKYKVSEILKMLNKDGWYLYKQRGIIGSLSIRRKRVSNGKCKAERNLKPRDFKQYF